MTYKVPPALRSVNGIGSAYRPATLYRSDVLAVLDAVLGGDS